MVGFSPEMEGVRPPNAEKHGIAIKVVTGDDVAVGREIARKIGLGDAIQPAAGLFKKDTDVDNLSAQANSDIEQADVGIAVSGATDAAHSAAALVLTAPGLSVIVRAVEEARRVFERMNSDAIDRIVETIRIMFFVAPARILRCISGFAQMGKDLPQRSGGVAGVIQCGSSVRAVVLFGGNEVDVTVETEFPLLAEFLGRFRQSVQLSQGDTGNFGRMLEKETSHVVPLRRIDPDPGTTRQLSQGPPRLSNCTG